MAPSQMVFDAIRYNMDYERNYLFNYEYMPVSKVFIKIYKTIIRFVIDDCSKLVLVSYYENLPEVIKLHKKYPDIINKYGYNTVFIMIRDELDFSIIKYICENGANFDVNSDENLNTLMLMACSGHRFEIIKYLYNRYSKNIDIKYIIDRLSELNSGYVINYLNELINNNS